MRNLQHRKALPNREAMTSMTCRINRSEVVILESQLLPFRQLVRIPVERCLQHVEAHRYAHKQSQWFVGSPVIIVAQLIDIDDAIGSEDHTHDFHPIGMDVQIQDTIYSIDHKIIAGPSTSCVGNIGLAPIGYPLVA